MRLRPLTGLLLVSLLHLHFPAFASGQTGEEAMVRRAAESVLLALSAGDTATLAGLLMPEAMIYSVREGGAGPVLGSRTRTSFLEGIGGDDRELLERMWNPTVLVRDEVATVWTAYDFHLEGEFSHCGVDVFTFLKGVDGWKVASITYSVVREDCPPSPLGPPGR